MQIVTLTTDFGSGDYDLGSMMGVIWSRAPGARLVDLTHEIERHHIRQAALALDRCTPYFPAGTIHLVVVDPGVGTQRKPLAAQLGDQWFVGPDNGLLTLMLRRAQAAAKPVKIVHTHNRQYWLSQVSSIFHGRDVFASVAGYLAAGIPVSKFGAEIDDVVLLDFPKPQPHAGGWLGQVMDIDHFGNLETNIHRDRLQGYGALKVTSGSYTIYGLVRTFGDGRPGDLVALIDSSDYLSIGLVNGNAAAHMAAHIGDPVLVHPFENQGVQ
ncbi:MAG TPA: SAM-dependent chlorinase/fluorinase [Levilinea sp.]|nr:SAM-dependent chlorinase/fluorinase [Levilinea sp.]